MSKSLLLFALQVIQDECLRHDYCNESCPFYTEEECGIQNDHPSQWVILKEDPVEEKLLY